MTTNIISWSEGGAARRSRAARRDPVGVSRRRRGLGGGWGAWRRGALVLMGWMLAGAAGVAFAAPAPWTPQADPYAANPFPVPYVQTPAKASERWAGFESRVGTNLPNDLYHWWRHDVTNRAQMQDMWWREEMVAAQTPMDWNGDFDTWKPGMTSQAWRNATLRMLNLQRYNYVQQVPGQAMNFVRENLDLLPTLQATALVIANGGPKSYYHNLMWEYPSRRPDNCPDDLWALAVVGAANNLGGSGRTAYENVANYLTDSGNPNAGHRMSFLNPVATMAASADVGLNWHPQDFGSARRQAGKYDTQNVFNSFAPGEVEYALWDAAPTQNPFRNASFWPYAGYVPIDLFSSNWTPFSVSLPSQALILVGTENYSDAGKDGFNPAELKVTVKVNGVVVPTRNVNITVNGPRSIIGFEVGHGFMYTPGAHVEEHDAYVTLPEDVAFEVTMEGLRYNLDWALRYTYRNGAPYDASLFRANAVSWRFTVFDPYKVKPVAYRSQSPVGNLSTRAGIGQGDRVLIAGLTVTGDEPLQVCLRAQGPGLARWGVTRPATNPQIDLYQIATGGQNRSLGSNDDWAQGGNWRLVQSYGLNPNDAKESALVATLMPGLYTAVVRDAGAGGVGLVEAFAIDPHSRSRLANVSTRAVVGTGEEAMIAGFVLQETSTIVVRAQGPSLAAYGVTDPVTDPVLRVVRQADGVEIDRNDDWDVPANARLKTDLAAYRPAHAQEAARVLTLPPGLYTVLVEGKGAPGVGLVEVFRLD